MAGYNFVHWIKMKSGFMFLNKFSFLHGTYKIMYLFSCHTRPQPAARRGPAQLQHINWTLCDSVCFHFCVSIVNPTDCTPCEKLVVDIVLLFSLLFRLRAVCSRHPSRWGAQWTRPGDVQSAAQQLSCCPRKVRLSATLNQSLTGRTHTHTWRKKNPCSIREVAQSDITSPLSNFCSWCFIGTVIIAVIAF